MELSMQPIELWSEPLKRFAKQVVDSYLKKRTSLIEKEIKGVN